MADEKRKADLLDALAEMISAPKAPKLQAKAADIPRPTEKKGTLLTSVDEFLQMVRERRKVTLHTASIELQIPESTIESWALILDKKKYVRLVYPENPLERTYVELVNG